MMESEKDESMLPPTDSEGLLAMMQRNNPVAYARFQSLSPEQKDIAIQNMLAFAAAARSGRTPGHGHGHSHGDGSSGICRHNHSPPTTRLNQPIQTVTSETPPSEMNIVQAIQFNQIGRVKELIESGKSDVNGPDAEGCFLLHWAAINNHVELVRYLISRGAQVDIKGGDLQSTPLHWACRQGCTETFFILIDNGAAIDSTDINGIQPIHLAAEFNQIKMVAFLLGSGIDVNCQDGRGFTPLMHAALGPPQGYQQLPGSSHVNCTQFLLSFGASINYQEPNNHYTALHMAIGNFNLHSFFALTDHPQINIGLKSLKNEGCLDLARFRKNEAATNFLESMTESNKRHVRPACMQRFLARQNVRIWLTRLYLFIMLTMIGLIANLEDYSGWLRLLAIIVIGFALTRASIYYIFDDQFKENLAFSYLISATILMYTTYIIYLEFDRWTFLNLMYHFLTLYGLFSVYLVRNVNPGYISQQTIGSDGSVVAKEKICLAFGRDPRWGLEHFCVSCLIRRPLRSKHCPVDKRCIAKFDHHCAWLGACIGYRNHFHFMRILVCGMLALHIWLYQSYKIITKDREDFSLKFLFTKYYESWFIYMFILTIFNGIWVTLMTWCHLINSIYFGLTFNERLTGLRYSYFRDETTNAFRNPFKKDFVKNFCETFGFFRFMSYLGYSRIDWTQVYELYELQSVKTT